MIKFYWSIISKLSKPWKETNPLLYWKGISNFVVKNVFRPDFIYSMMKVQLQWATTTAGAVTQGPGSWAPSARGRGGLEGVLVVCDDLMVRCGEEYFQSCPGERWRVTGTGWHTVLTQKAFFRLGRPDTRRVARRGCGDVWDSARLGSEQAALSRGWLTYHPGAPLSLLALGHLLMKSAHHLHDPTSIRKQRVKTYQRPGQHKSTKLLHWVAEYWERFTAWQNKGIL